MAESPAARSFTKKKLHEAYKCDGVRTYHSQTKGAKPPAGGTFRKQSTCIRQTSSIARTDWKKKKLKKKENEAKSSCTLILDLPKVAIYVRTLSGRWIYYKQHNQPAVFSKPHDSIPRSRPNQPTSTLFPGHSIQAGQSNLESKHTIQALITGIGFGLGSVGRLQAPAQNLRK